MLAGRGEGTRLVVRGRLAERRGAHIMARIRALRKDIARIKTVLRERETGIRGQTETSEG